MNTLEIKRIENINEAKLIWNKLSPDKTLCDNWDFRYCFYKYFNYPLYFYAGFDKGEIVGLLPLQFNEQDKQLEFFGGNFMRDNHVFIKPGYEECIPQFYNAISQPAKMQSIVGGDEFTKSFEIYKYKYIANLSGLKNADDYFLKGFTSRSRKKLRNKLKLIEPYKPEVILNNFEDIDFLIDLNRKNFGERSSFNKPHRHEIFHDLFKLDLDFYFMSYVINGKKEAASFSLKYKDTFVYINSGTNKDGIPGLGSYVIFKQIEKAIETGASSLDAGLGDSGWKEIWHLEKVPQRIFIKEHK